MKLHEALERLANAHFSTPPEPRRLQRVAQKILDTWPDLQVLPRNALDRLQILENFLERIRQWHWEDATYAELNRAARLAFDPEFLGEHHYEPIRRFVLEELTVNENCAFIITAFRIYWESWKAGAPHTTALAQRLETIMADKQRRDCLKRWHALLAEANALFTPQAAPAVVAGLLLDAEDVSATRQTLQLRALPLRGLQEEALALWLRESRKTAHEEKTVSRILEWLETDEQATRMPRLAAEAIEALVRPWLSRDCPDELRQKILDQILNRYKDPRVNLGDPWPRVSQKIKDRLYYWLAGRDIDFFMDVIEQSLTDKDDDLRMWNNRRYFWKDLHKKHLIKDSWVAFSEEAIRVLKSMNKGHFEYGRQVARGNRKRTSLLIMKIEETIIVEGSHNYMVHVFCQDNIHAPRLHQKNYDCEDIRHHSDYQTAHLGNWENRVMEYIYYCD